jgi:hypothetical protein
VNAKFDRGKTVTMRDEYGVRTHKDAVDRGGHAASVTKAISLYGMSSCNFAVSNESIRNRLRFLTMSVFVSR